MVSSFRPTVAEIDLAAIRHNVRALAPPSAELLAVVKANGYGHGDVPVARAALEAGATWLGVALVEEGLRLREAGIGAPVLVLSEFPPGSEKDALAAELTPTLYSEASVERVAEAARAVGRAPGVHVKLDTGMRRVGLPPERATEFVRTVVGAGLEFEGLWSHFAVADPSHPAVGMQLERFLAASEALGSAGFLPRYRHLASTGAAIAFPDAHFDLVRVGIGLYGLLPDPSLAGRVDLRPAMRWRSAVTFAKRVAAGEGVSYNLRWTAPRETTVATVAVGYADGYPRALTNRGQVLIHGRRHPVVGTVTMDQTLVDAGDDAVEPGDEVVLFGEQDGAEITAEEVAGWLGTIGYEVVCGVGGRVPREVRD